MLGTFCIKLFYSVTSLISYFTKSSAYEHGSNMPMDRSWTGLSVRLGKKKAKTHTPVSISGAEVEQVNLWNYHHCETGHHTSQPWIKKPKKSGWINSGASFLVTFTEECIWKHHKLPWFCQVFGYGQVRTFKAMTTRLCNSVVFLMLP